MNVDATWIRGKSSIVVLARNYQDKVFGLWFENLECSSLLAAELLAIKKACTVSSTFPNKDIQIESDCKVVVESLLGICVCPWKALTKFLIVKCLLNSMERVDFLWCPRDYKESVHKTTKWMENVVKVGNGFLTNVPPNVDVFIMNDAFDSLNE